MLARFIFTFFWMTLFSVIADIYTQPTVILSDILEFLAIFMLTIVAIRDIDPYRPFRRELYLFAFRAIFWGSLAWQAIWVSEYLGPTAGILLFAIGSAVVSLVWIRHYPQLRT